MKNSHFSLNLFQSNVFEIASNVYEISLSSYKASHDIKTLTQINNLIRNNEFKCHLTSGFRK